MITQKTNARYTEALKAMEAYIQTLPGYSEMQRDEILGLIRGVHKYADGQECAWVRFALDDRNAD